MPNEKEQSTRFQGYSGLARSFCLFVLLPTLIGGIHFGVIATDRYVAEARYAIRTGAQAPGGGFLETVLGTGSLGTSTREDTGIVRDYILSHDLLEELQGRIGLRFNGIVAGMSERGTLAAVPSVESSIEYLALSFLPTSWKTRSWP